MKETRRRSLFSFLSRAAGLSGAAGMLAVNSAEALPPESPLPGVTLPSYVKAPVHKTLRQSSYDRTGGNRDFFSIAPGQTIDVFQASGAGIITHIWFTIAAQSTTHLKEVVLRIYWEGSARPSVQVPVGDFFGLNLGDYFVYQSAFLNCSSVKALNCYFAMPFRRSARITVTNEGQKPVGSFYSNIDYQVVASVPADAMYFHAEYRQAVPNAGTAEGSDLNLSGVRNYLFMETQGTGQLMGVTLGVVQNRSGWFGEGDDMTMIDQRLTGQNQSAVPTISGKDIKPKPIETLAGLPAITGTGTEDYFCGAWNFGGVNGATPFAHLYNGAPSIALAERTGGRYCLYRWHADNPIAFEKSIRHTIEHGHANDRSDCFYSVAYWYQTRPAAQVAELPNCPDRVPQVKLV